MPPSLKFWIFVLIIPTGYSPRASAQPVNTVRVWLEDSCESEENVGAKHDRNWVDFTEHPVSAAIISRISTMKGVTALDIGYFPDVVQIDGKALSKIGCIKGLRSLNCYITGVNEDDWQFLAKLSDLEELLVDGERLELGDDFLRYVSRLKNLRTLRIQQSDFTDEGIKKLASLKNLTELSLTSPLMTDRSLKTISEFSKLKTLYLSSPHLRDDKPKDLSNLKELQELTIYPGFSTDVESLYPNEKHR